MLEDLKFGVYFQSLMFYFGFFNAYAEVAELADLPAGRQARQLKYVLCLCDQK